MGRDGRRFTCHQVWTLICVKHARIWAMRITTLKLPVGYNGDAYDRCMVKSRRDASIVTYYSSVHGQYATGPTKPIIRCLCHHQRPYFERYRDVLINHFISVSCIMWCQRVNAPRLREATKRSDQLLHHLRQSHDDYRAPVFVRRHLRICKQMPSVINGSLVSDAIMYLASIDIVMADCDR